MNGNLLREAEQPERSNFQQAVTFHMQPMGVLMTHMELPTGQLVGCCNPTNADYQPETGVSVRKPLQETWGDSADPGRAALAAKRPECLRQRDGCLLLLRHESEIVLPARAIYIHKSIL